MKKPQLLDYVTAFDLRLGILPPFDPKPSFHRVLGLRKSRRARGDSNAFASFAIRPSDLPPPQTKTATELPMAVILVMRPDIAYPR